MIVFAILAIGCATLLVPLFTPPAPFYPTWLGFTPYAALFCSAFLARHRGEEIALVVSSLILLAGYFYLDSIYFNRVFSWHVVGLVQDYLPMFQLAIVLSVLTVFLLRRWRLMVSTMSCWQSEA